jgi:hypothetical protein
MTQTKTMTLALAASVAILSSAGLAAAQSSVGAPNKPRAVVGGPTLQTNPTVVTPRGRQAIPVSTPPKPLPLPPMATKQPPKQPLSKR